MKLKKYLDSLSIKAGLLALVSLSGCIATTLPYMRAETAQRIAAPAWMIKREIPASPFILRAYERIHDKGGIANIYIEGEGSEVTSAGEWEMNPTPQNPVALHLASKDNTKNVIYIARPCQFTGLIDSDQTCDPSVWKEARFSSEVITSYSTALDLLRKRHGLKGFNLIGYSGGAAIATLLAAKRGDILSVRTVAGILDHKAYTEINNLSPLSASLNPIDYASKLKNIPQVHFIGGQDKIIPPAILHSYLQKVPPSKCVDAQMIQAAGYSEGWVNEWPELLKTPINCFGNSTYETIRAQDLNITGKKPNAALNTIKTPPQKP